MNDKMVEKLTKMVSRRGVLARLTTGAAALASSLLGTSKASAALVSVACCLLCNNSSTCSSCNCTWSWTCQDRFLWWCDTYSCIECYMVTWPCSGSCTNVKCSQALRISGC
jgi:hypothetical protein